MPPQKSNLGPESFSLDFIDTYDTLDPQAPITGLQTSVDVSICVNWNLARTALEEKGVEIGPIVWSQAGSGPHNLYADQLGLPGRKKIGTVEWSVVTKIIKWVQEDRTRFRYVVTVNPILFITKKLLEGGAPFTEERQSQPNPCYGAWQLKPTSLAAPAKASAEAKIKKPKKTR